MLYTPTARFDTGRALTEDELHKLAPSVFATTRHESRSERFAPIPTIEIVRKLATEGFNVVGAKQQMVRTSTGTHGKHLLRIRRNDPDHKYQVGDTVLEMYLKNANDGSSVYDLFAGLFKIACLNSMVSQDRMIDAVKVRHTGDAASKVVDATYRVLDQSQKVLEVPVEWSKKLLAPPQQEAFAEAARVVRFGDKDGNVDTPVTAKQLLIPRRVEDEGNDLWSTFNRVQENTVRGGLSAVRRDDRSRNRTRRFTTRPINGIDQDIKLNRALWVLAEKLAEAV